MRILLFQHQAHGRRLFHHMLARLDHDVVDCTQVAGLPAALEAGPYELVLASRSLPGAQIGDLVRSLRDHEATARAVIAVLISHEQRAEIPMLLNAGADDFLILPAGLDELQLRVRVLLNYAARIPEPEADASGSPGGSDIARAFDVLPCAALVVDESGQLLLANQQLAGLTGFEAASLAGQSGEFIGLPMAEDASRLVARIRQSGGEAQAFTLVRRDMKPVPVEIAWSAVEGSARKLAVGLVRPLQTEAVAGEGAVDGPREPAGTGPIDPVAALTFDHDGWIWLVSPALAAMIGKPAGKLIGENLKTVVHPDDLPAIPRLIARSQTGGLRREPALIRLRRSDGAWLTVRATGREAEAAGGRAKQFVIEVASTEHQTGAGTPRRPGTSPMVCLSGRDEFLLLAEEIVADRDLEREPVGLLFISLDEFRALNQAHGYEAGDAMLDAVSRRLMSHLAAEDVFARIGTDEFAALLASPCDHARAAGLAGRMIEDLRANPLRVPSGQETAVSASIGIALSSDDTKTVANLLRRADMATSVAKQAGRGRYEIFDPVIEIRNTNRLQIEQDLVQAIARDEFRVYFQPEVQLMTGAIVGAEALIRWEHPTNGLIMPGHFIEMAETAELIVPIGVRVLEKAARRAAAWRGQFALDEQFVVGVNFSIKQLQRPEIVDEVLAILEHAQLPASALRIEITESSALDHDSGIIEILERLRASGIHLAIDDFGTGYASLTQLRALPIDTVKIDRSFVSGASTGSGQLSIARSVMSMARSSGMEVVVEGIETSNQLKHVLHSDCTRGQGFYFSRPITSETLEFWLKAGPRPFNGAIAAARGDNGRSSVPGSSRKHPAA